MQQFLCRGPFAARRLPMLLAYAGHSSNHTTPYQDPYIRGMSVFASSVGQRTLLRIELTDSLLSMTTATTGIVTCVGCESARMQQTKSTISNSDFREHLPGPLFHSSDHFILLSSRLSSAWHVVYCRNKTFMAHERFETCQSITHSLLATDRHLTSSVWFRGGMASSLGHISALPIGHATCIPSWTIGLGASTRSIFCFVSFERINNSALLAQLYETFRASPSGSAARGPPAINGRMSSLMSKPTLADHAAPANPERDPHLNMGLWGEACAFRRSDPPFWRLLATCSMHSWHDFSLPTQRRQQDPASCSLCSRWFASQIHNAHVCAPSKSTQDSS
ncbi:uncharacterized protein CC84DRAFT_1207208 [Paraphaeosphaeria sporulosa]|uniref:Uncharacterized protein n=1 Tax=Paraphaeosphaeria sporulosa TaxID=1460663 RepID=A0A177CB93_9PLEO|nr:uncharacterized protein CC84DRAFT_1207208 [Paraphaeosphaeria sporulosa]OAG03980.1 hypothetical protein CC84DRAFT_1207208 [Paraphaeosphaeria sporulosa]